MNTRSVLPFALVVSFAIFSVIMIACDKAKTGGEAISVSNGTIRDYGHGVYYFPYTQSDFATKVSEFLGNHPTYEIVAVAGNGNDTYGEDMGYFVFINDTATTNQSSYARDPFESE